MEWKRQKAAMEAPPAWVWLGVILLLGGILRFWGISHGFPYSYYPDEAHFVKRALSFGSGDLNPHWFHKPAFFMYLLFFEYGIFFVLGRIAGMWNGVEAFAVSYVLNPGPFYLIGRSTVAFFGLGMVFLVYKAGSRLWHRRAGLLAAVFLAAAPGQAWVAKDVKADVPCAFFTLLSACLLLRFAQEKRNRDLWLSAVAAGIGVATKTYTLVMVVPMIAAVLLRRKETGGRWAAALRRGGAVVLVVYGVFFLASPYNFLDAQGRFDTFSKFYLLAGKVGRALGMEPKGVFQAPEGFAEDIHNPDHSFGVYAAGAADYARNLSDGMGLPSFLMAGAGILLFCFRERRWNALIFFVFPVIFVGISVFLHPGYADTRHQVPVHPFLALWAAGVVVFMEKKGMPASVTAALLGVALAFPVWETADHNRTISRQDPRNLAKEWIETHIPSGAKMLVDENGVQLLRSEDALREMIRKAQEADPEGQFTAHYDRYLEYQRMAAHGRTAYDVQYIRLPWWRDREVSAGEHALVSEFDRDMGNPLKPVGVNSYETYVREGNAYAVVHSRMYDQFVRDTDRAKRFPSFARFYRDLFQRGRLVRTFSPDGPPARPGPTVKIFRLRNPVAEGTASTERAS
jgi:4-amino-4-deoxy-L-arabinose transferase-like glycosyltransferase